MTEPCYTCMASRGKDGFCLCLLFNCPTIEATRLFCTHHKYHVSLLQYQDYVYGRDSD
jgi:hypothetical protein